MSTILWIMLAAFAIIILLPAIVGCVGVIVALAPYALIGLIMYLIFKLFNKDK